MNLLTPNTITTKKVASAILLTEVVLFLLILTVYKFSYFPTPYQVLEAFPRMLSNHNFMYELMVSLKLNFKAILISTVVSLTISYASTIPIIKPISGLFAKFRFVGMTGLVFLFSQMVSGDGSSLKLMLLSFGMSVFFIEGMNTMIRNIKSAEYDYARTLRLNEWQVLWHVVIRGKLGETILILRGVAAIGIAMLTMVEGISRSEGGIGTLMLSMDKYFSLPEVFALNLTMLLYGIFQDVIIEWGRTTALPYCKLRVK